MNTTDTHTLDILAFMRDQHGDIETKRDHDGTLVKLPSGRIRLVLNRRAHSKAHRRAHPSILIPKVCDVGPLRWEEPCLR